MKDEGLNAMLVKDGDIAWLRCHVAQLTQSISQLSTTNKPGRGQGEELVAVLEEGLKWIPILLTLLWLFAILRG